MNKALIGVGVAGAIVLVVGGGWAYRYFTAPIEGALEQRETVQSGGSRIYNYNRFFSLCASVQSFEDQIDSQEQLLENTSDEDHLSMIRRNISGLNAQRQNTIATYNSEARAIETGGQFRDDGLPESINRDLYNGSNRTSCQ